MKLISNNQTQVEAFGEADMHEFVGWQTPERLYRHIYVTSMVCPEVLPQSLSASSKCFKSW